MTGLPAYLGIRTIEMGPARMIAELDVREELLNPFGSAHGGVIAGLVDHVLGMVLYPVIERGKWAATTEFKINLLAPVTAGRVEAAADVVSMSRRLAVVRIDVHNVVPDDVGTGDRRRLVAVAQGTSTIVAPKTG